MRQPLIRIDFDAAFWFVAALILSAFATLPALAIGLALLHHALDGMAYVLVTGGVTAIAYGLAAALLVRARPWRRLRDMLLTLYAMQIVGTLLLGLEVMIQNHNLFYERLTFPMIGALTFGAVQIDSLHPLRIAFPDMWPLIGVLVGFGTVVGFYRLRGIAVGEAARVVITPWPMPESLRSVATGGERTPRR